MLLFGLIVIQGRIFIRKNCRVPLTFFLCEILCLYYEYVSLFLSIFLLSFLLFLSSLLFLILLSCLSLSMSFMSVCLCLSS